MEKNKRTSTKIKRGVKWLFCEILHFLVCIMIPLMTGFFICFIAGAYSKEGNFYYVKIGFSIGLLIWIVHVFLRSGCAKISLNEYNKDDESFLSDMDIFAKHCYCQVKRIYCCRDYAAKRLTQNEFWIQIISIYYSVFTAVLAVLGLVGGKKNDFLDVPSVLFTVAVAILVTFANAQRCGARAKDLSSNCSDLGDRLSEVLSETNNPDRSNREKESTDALNALKNSDENLRKYMSNFYKNLGDSEEHSIVDEWKYCNSWLYYVYLSVKILFIWLLIMAPLLFVFFNLIKFKALIEAPMLQEYGLIHLKAQLR